MPPISKRTERRRACSKKGSFPLYRTNKSGAERKTSCRLQCLGQPIAFHLTGGQVSDYMGAAALLDSLPQSRELLADRGYDADWFRNALLDKGITPCIPGRQSRKKPIPYDKEL